MPGTIVFKPIEANLSGKDKDLFGKMDPYCLFHVGLHTVKGQVCKSGGHHPVWNDEIPLEIKDQTTCIVDVKDKDMLTDDKIGSFEIDLREIETKGQVKKWYPIFDKDKPMGEILLEAFCAGTRGFQQQGLPQQGFSQQGLSQGYQQNLPQQGLSQQGLGQGSYQQNLPQQGFSQGYQQSFPQQGLSQQGLGQGSYQQNLPQQGLSQGYQQNLPQQGLSQQGLGQGSYQQNLPQQVSGQGYQSFPTSGGISTTGGSSLRGADPTSLQSKPGYTTIQSQGLTGQQFGQSLGPSSSLGRPGEGIYEGDISRFNQPPHQMPFGHGHHTPQDSLNPLNQPQNLSENKPQQFKNA